MSELSEPMNLRERNKRRARAEIADVALELFRERGFDAVTVDDIISRAGVSRRTFFRYFESKEDALLADYPRLQAMLDEALSSLEEGTALDAARRTLHRVAEYYLDRRREVVARSNVMRDSSAAAARNLRLLAQWEQAIARAIEARLGGTDSDLLSRTTAILIVSAFRAALSEWVRSGAKDDLHQLLDQTFDLLEHGLAKPLAEHALVRSGSKGKAAPRT